MRKKTEHAPMDDLVQFLRARFAEDEMWAIEGSREEITRQTPHGGAHWRWVSSDTGDELTPDPRSEPTLGHEAETPFVSLLSREEWTSPSLDTPLPQSVLDAEEVPSAAAGHIIRHDPARALRDVEAKRRLLQEHTPARPPGCPTMERHCGSCTTAQVWDEAAGESTCRTMRLLALPYAGHPDYRPEWRP